MSEIIDQAGAPVVVDATGFLDTLKRRWWIVVVGAVLVGAAATAMTVTRPTMYTSYGTVLVYPLGVDPEQTSRTLVSDSVDLEVEEELAGSYLVASTAVDGLGPDLALSISSADPIRELRRTIAIASRGDRILEISYTHELPSVAQQVTAAYTDAYLETRVALLESTRAEALTSVDETAAELTDRLAEVDAQLAELDAAAEARAIELAAEEAAALEAAGEAAPTVRPSIPESFDQTDPLATGLLFEQDDLRKRLAELDRQRTQLSSDRSLSGELIGPPLLPETPSTPADIQVAIAGIVAGALLGLVVLYLLSLSKGRHLVLTPALNGSVTAPTLRAEAPVGGVVTAAPEAAPVAETDGVTTAVLHRGPTTSIAEPTAQPTAAPAAPTPAAPVPASAPVPPTPSAPNLGTVATHSCSLAATGQPTNAASETAVSVLHRASELGLGERTALAIVGESTSDLATPLALSLGRAIGTSGRVLVIATDFDTDVVGQQLGLASNPGLANALSGGAATPLAVAPGLDVLHSGRGVGGERMEIIEPLLAHFRPHYDVVLLAVPNLSRDPRAWPIADAAQGCILVVDSLGGTNLQTAQAIEAIAGRDTVLLGTVSATVASAEVLADTAPAIL